MAEWRKSCAINSRNLLKAILRYYANREASK